MSTAAALPLLHLWVYNHPLQGIGDQLEFFFLLLKQQGYPVSMGRKPRQDALNVVIENFSEVSSQTLIDFCQQTGKRVGLIMTEHLDLHGSELLIHGERLWNDNDYMPPAVQVARIKNLMDCVPWLRAIFVLGDLPQLEGSERMFPGVPVRALPFPQLPMIDVEQQMPQYDFVFSGGITAFRTQVLQKVGASHSLAHTTEFLPRKGRDQLNTTARLVLNIPQRPGWRWLSLMRIIAALNCGRATVSVATEDTSWIARCCYQLAESEWEGRLGEMRTDWQAAYLQAYERYELMRRDFLAERGFPSDLLEYWALLEKSRA
ncbi:hypothetical protein [Herbaspirillum seropedicae]|uniref:hypothetical protein n=1 Tax=Herbaspirillum seropedicae TaxID=964 RepID=UPI000847FB5E|nr:hypothetical protein [Herbaspirillum seropedicae]AON52602.1 hypothetical protein Hsc_0289 [Herbaspirillum seropedicae]